MKLPIALSLPVTLAVSLAAYACSSSGSSASPGSDASTGDDAGVHTGNDDDAGLADASSATTDSSNGDVSDSSNGNTLDSSSNTSDSSTTADASALSFATDIYAPILEVHCVGCHALQADGGALSGVEFGKLDMSTVDAGYANLVNVPATGVACAEVDGSAGPVRVVPGDAASSLLWDKVNAYLDPPAVCGGAMPKSGEIPDGGQAIVAAQIQTWINQGARP